MSADIQERARRAAKRHGFTLLFASACLGFALELAHALKLSAYLDVPLRRELLTWAHAHGMGLSLLLLAYAAVGVVDAASAAAERSLAIGSLLVPLGFLLGSLTLHENDPGVGIVLVPLGALTVLSSLFLVMRAAYRQPR